MPPRSATATAWLHEREPRCGNPITEAWLLSILINGTLSAPNPAVVARLQRLAQTSPSPSVKAIAGFTLHGCRYLNPKLGDGLDLGDIVDGLRHATVCSQASGNLLVEVTCMTLAVIPLTDRAERSDAAALHATLERIHEIRYDLALTFLGARLAVWLVRIGRPDAASVIDGWLHTHNNPYPAIQPTLAQLDQLLGSSSFPTERSRGAIMTLTELSDYLDGELAFLTNDDTGSSS